MRQRLAGNRSLVRQDDLSVPRALDDLCLCRVFVNDDIAEGFQISPAEVTGIECMAVQDDDLESLKKLEEYELLMQRYQKEGS